MRARDLGDRVLPTLLPMRKKAGRAHVSGQSRILGPKSGGKTVKLMHEQSQKILREHGVWVNSACDKCGAVLGPIRYTRRDERGEWCSRFCRDGVEHKALGLCQTCGVALIGKRIDARFCSDNCRKAFPGYQIIATTPNYPGIVAHSKRLTDRGRGFGCPYTKRAEAPQT